MIKRKVDIYTGNPSVLPGLKYHSVLNLTLEDSGEQHNKGLVKYKEGYDDITDQLREKSIEEFRKLASKLENVVLVAGINEAKTFKDNIADGKGAYDGRAYDFKPFVRIEFEAIAYQLSETMEKNE